MLALRFGAWKGVESRLRMQVSLGFPRCRAFRGLGVGV